VKIMNGYSVILDDNPNRVGIVDAREGADLRVRYPNDPDRPWEWIARARVKAVAEAIAEKCIKGARYSASLSIAGKGTLGELAAAFGFNRLRSDIRERIDTSSSARA
jgi:hypothetical protein